MVQVSKSVEIPSGLSHMIPFMMALISYMTLQYTVLYFYFGSQDSIFGLYPADEFCKDRSPCIRSDLFAFQMTSFVPILFCGFYGIYAWQTCGNTMHSPEERLFGYNIHAERIAAACFTFQVWDFVISLLIPEHCTPIMLTHHAMAALVSFFAVHGQFLHYYGIYFLGLVEVSSIFLVWQDMSTYFPATEGTFYGSFVFGCGVCFAITFIYFRVIRWWPVSLQLFRDIMAVQSVVSKRRPGLEWVLWMYLACNLPLGLLQLYWLTIVLEGIQKAVMGE